MEVLGVFMGSFGKVGAFDLPGLWERLVKMMMVALM